MRPSERVWPTMEQERLLELALRPSAAALDSLRRLDVARLDAGSRRLLPLLYPALRDLDARGPLIDEAQAEYCRTTSWNAVLLQRAHGLIQELTTTGVPTLVLKGVALVLTCYRDPGLRSMADLDLWIPITRLFPALTAFHRGGWHLAYALTPSFVRTRHAAPFISADGIPCDLHWRVFAEPTPPGVEEALWQASIRVDFRGTPTRVLSHADQLLHVCLHGARWASMPAVWWVSDAIAVIRTGHVDWDRVVSLAVRGRFVLRVRETLAYLRDRVNADVPADVLTRLRALPASGLERLEWRLIAREHRILGELPTYWCHHRRSEGGAGVRGVLGFPRYLGDAWGVKSPAQVPRAAILRAAARVGAALRRLGPSRAT